MGLSQRRGGVTGDEPAFGYGQGGRPVATVRDRDAEEIRAVLRKARRRELTERYDGFVVEGGGGGTPFLVACTGENSAAAAKVAAYAQVLAAAGFQVTADPYDDHCVRCWITAR